MSEAPEWASGEMTPAGMTREGWIDGNGDARS